MTSIPRIVSLTLILAGFSIFAAETLRAGDSAPDASIVTPDPGPPSLQQESSAAYSYVGDGSLKNGAKGDLNEQTSRVDYRLKVPIGEAWSISAGAGYDRVDFGTPSGSALPENIQTVSLNMGVGYQFSKEWSAFGSVLPRMGLVNGWEHIDSDNLELGGMLGGTYAPNENLMFLFGLALNPDIDDLPVLPILGLRWKFADQWTLNLGAPRTSLDYQVMDKLVLSLEGTYVGGNYHTGSDYGTLVGRPELNDRKLTYNEIRAGAAVTYSLLKNLEAKVGGGAALFRQFDFKDSGFEPKVDPAPYVSASLIFKF